MWHSELVYTPALYNLKSLATSNATLTGLIVATACFSCISAPYTSQDINTTVVKVKILVRKSIKMYKNISKESESQSDFESQQDSKSHLRDIDDIPNFGTNCVRVELAFFVFSKIRI